MKDNERIIEEEFSVMLLKFPELIYALYYRAEDEIDRLNENNQAMQEEMAKTWEENERLKKQNNDLRKIYRNTYQRLFNNGNDELARYFQAQIDDCPTFYVEPIIDYHKEWKDYKSRCEKAIEYINNFDIDKKFSFPLMKRWEENQVKSSIEYEFKDTLYKDLLNILNGSDE